MNRKPDELPLEWALVARIDVWYDGHLRVIARFACYEDALMFVRMPTIGEPSYLIMHNDEIAGLPE